MVEHYRLFIAIEFPQPETLHEPIAAVQAAVPRGVVRWVRPETMHLTLKFLGDVPTTQLDTVSEHLKRAASDNHHFGMVIKGVGCFPNHNRPTVIWLGLHNAAGELHALRDAVEAAIAPLGYPTENRPFRPHLTLGRVKRGIDGTVQAKIGRGIKELTLGKIADWPCDAVRLMRSELSSDGPRYTCLTEIPLR